MRDAMIILKFTEILIKEIKKTPSPLFWDVKNLQTKSLRSRHKPKNLSNILFSMGGRLSIKGSPLALEILSLWHSNTKNFIFSRLFSNFMVTFSFLLMRRAVIFYKILCNDFPGCFFEEKVCRSYSRHPPYCHAFMVDLWTYFHYRGSGAFRRQLCKL